MNSYDNDHVLKSLWRVKLGVAHGVIKNWHNHVILEMTPKWYFLWEPLTSTCKILVLFWYPLEKRSIFAV
jgi:hypothetical protein